MPSYITNALEKYEKSYQPPKPPEPGAKPAPSLSQKEIERRAWMLSLIYEFISRPLAAWIASLWMSYVPLLRSVAYEILSIQFYLRHICRLQPMPLGIFKMLAGRNKEIYETIMGPSEFFCPGLLKDWDISPHLSKICLPTLILSGFYDEATPAQMAVLKDRIANSEQIILEQSAHCGMWEEPEKFRAAILDFINRHP
jgi:pimeloyl-ACP methyl ester carboxylesterase